MLLEFYLKINYSQMMKPFILIVLFFALIFLLGAIYKDPKIINKLENYANNNYNKNQNVNAKSIPNKTEGMNIDISNQGFSPQILTIKQNTKVYLNNKTDNNQSFINESLNKEFYLKDLPTGKFLSIFFDKIGTFSYKLKLNSQQKLTIIVEQ